MHKYNQEIYLKKYHQYELKINSLGYPQLLALWSKDSSNLLENYCDFADFKRKLTNYLCKEENYEIEEFLKNHSIKESDLLRFLNKNDIREMSFFKKFCEKELSSLIFSFDSFSEIPNFFEDNIYIKCIQLSNKLYSESKTSYKLENFKKFQLIWRNILSNNRDISWINKEDLEQVQWAFSYIKKSEKSLFQPLMNDICLVSQSTQLIDNYLYVITEIDALSLGQPAEKNLFLDKMRRAWSQKKFRDAGKTKKAYHLPLTKETHKQLEFLSQILNKPQAQVLESIIRDKYQEYSNQKTGKNLY
ncbi:hypothetical protein F975_00835 [Acinetobacter sp. ANC 3789]|uniref:hypothetical protein n=1 Tax=Acinetobacter sp. ANC 3789 TaxID=1217714 RepID=UPI0002CF1FF3|nr:hypothetical protein [Acinetobacter sp. ANC 3789]ENU80977.1 hypothetical protein F975_00835 [Acinetobacter sp. ANC 3789]